MSRALARQASACAGDVQLVTVWLVVAVFLLGCEGTDGASASLAGHNAPDTTIAPEHGADGDAAVTCGPECDDGLPCTVDLCVDGLCHHEAAADGSSCGEGRVCGGGACGPEGARLVPADDLWLGCNTAIEAQSDCQYNEFPQHHAFISAFWLDTFEASVADYAQCRQAGACGEPFRAWAPSWKGTEGKGDKHTSLYNWGAPGRGKHPINGISWTQAKEFCQWRHVGGRLATEAEWEKAARGGCALYPTGECKQRMRIYPWGNDPADCNHAVLATGKGKWESGFGCGAGHTLQVGSIAADVGPYGHRGLAGSVSEWVGTAHVEDFYAQFADTLAVDPAPPGAHSGLRGVRGGGFYEEGFDARASYRHGHPPNQADYYVGVRCAVDVAE